MGAKRTRFVWRWRSSFSNASRNFLTMNPNTSDLAETKAEDSHAPAPANGKTGHPRSGRRAPVEATDSLDPRQLLRVLIAVRDGDFSVRLPAEMAGIDGKIADV